MKAIRLQCNHLYNPLGIDGRAPLLSWNLSGGRRQSGFELRAAHSAEELEKGHFFFESGIVETECMTGYAWPLPLHSRERVYWQLRITDETGSAGEWSAAAWFEMGLLHPSDWRAAWITGDYEPQPGVRYPADEFRKHFTLPENVRKARLYLSACGLYTARLNGRQIGEQVLTPGCTTYEKRVQYQTYDVTEFLTEGENEWHIMLGDGWFRGKMGVFGATAVYGNTTCVIGQMEITFQDGSEMVLGTDGSFLWSDDGKIRFNDMKDGETVDFSMRPSFKGRAKETAWAGTLCCSNNVPVKEHEHFQPVVLHTPDGNTVLDFGQNIAGYVSLNVCGEKGHICEMQMGEMLDEQGNFTVKNLITEDTSAAFIPDYCDDSRFQTIRLVMSGEREVYKPSFTVQGFRYAVLRDWPEEVLPENFEAIAVYSDLEFTADFSCSSPEIEKLVENTRWSIKGNFLDVPTDCPTRERSAWTGDAQLFFDTGCYFADMSAFFRKWVRDLYDDQAEDGKIYNIVPRAGSHDGANSYVEGSSGWTDGGILIPYRYYLQYRDAEILRSNYAGMKRLIAFLTSRMGDLSDPELSAKLPDSEYRKYIITSGFHFGEWNEPGSSMESVMAPKYEVATAYLFYSLQCMQEIAGILGEETDRKNWGELAEKIKAAYRYYFVPETGIEAKRMCEYVRPIALGILSPEETLQNGERLAALVKESGYHVGTGFLSTPFLLPVLSAAGKEEEAWRMLENPSYPGWIAEIKAGATTIWENWDGVASRNHYSNGAVCEWLFGYAAGIRQTGQNTFRIAPCPGGTLRALSFGYQSPYGYVRCSWNRTDTETEYRIHIPAGCSADICLPGCGIWKAEAGDYIRRISHESSQAMQ